MLDTVNDETLKLVINRYLRKIFALVFYLIGNDSDKTYQITASSYVAVFMSIWSLNDENALFIKLAQEAIEQSRNVKIIPSSKEPPFRNIPPERKKTLHILSGALQALPFDERALLLLRDQIHLSYPNIASILGISQHNVRSQISHARTQIRKKIEGALL